MAAMTLEQLKDVVVHLSPMKASLFAKRFPPPIFSVPAGRIAQAGLFNR